VRPRRAFIDGIERCGVGCSGLHEGQVIAVTSACRGLGPIDTTGVNDALIFLTAAKAGIPVLAVNRDEFDFIQQVAPEGHFVHY
jgi:hypothetical protein